ncbi:MAG TPA: 5-deoxy-glucuronate isomerase, partial [Actinomycetes bacterium]|nr:5-deoxy-glucuronate isomerase [Actinomycetes bacterium]
MTRDASLTVDRSLHLRAGSTAQPPYELVVTPERAGWECSGLRILRLAAGGRHEFVTDDEEIVVLPLSGACGVESDGQRIELQGRKDVWSGVTDSAYIPRDSHAVIDSELGGRFALTSARCNRRLPLRYLPAENVPIEVRGAGSCTRQVNGFCAAHAVEADRLIAVEVLTPAGNWSSYPPHKHDEDRPGEESALEEIYYFELRPEGSDNSSSGFGYQRVYGTVDRPIDVLAEVRTGDVVLVPHGWHGPSMAVPGYDLYYLNVMAGPSAERSWRVCDDPEHAWVRETWADQPPD